MADVDALRKYLDSIVNRSQQGSDTRLLLRAVKAALSVFEGTPHYDTWCGVLLAELEQENQIRWKSLLGETHRELEVMGRAVERAKGQLAPVEHVGPKVEGTPTIRPYRDPHKSYNPTEDFGGSDFAPSAEQVRRGNTDGHDF